MTADIKPTVVVRIRKSHNCGNELQEVDNLPDFIDNSISEETYYLRGDWDGVDILISGTWVVLL